MVRTVRSRADDEETRESSSPSDSAERKGVDQKGNASRSKHSETEQRRRSKINERFQILRDLIPERDQKRDKASFLLEFILMQVIQYIQYLHEKLQMYEGPCQGWSPESTKSLPWRINSGPGESFVDQPQLDRGLAGNEDGNIIQPTLLSNVQNSVESDLAEAAFYTATDNTSLLTKGLPMNMSLQGSIYEGLTAHPHPGSFHDADHLTVHQSQSHIWPGRSRGDDCSIPINAANEELLKTQSGEPSISNTYTQEVLNSLTSALQSSGVDLSQAIISVQLDVGGKRASTVSSNTAFDFKDDLKASSLNYRAPMNASWNNDRLLKRFKPD
ncbi:transcription factor BIM2-like isoform X2 [Andrographis paniculata]|uniref:transcription factor BIM2-like isoform X2 n=1 Tax=Andrographis paniculata TaxID=175694 RepID=UPI0021E90792|nr:transcription factor BIM2-like isoform X2 [Andrographis paniculata]